MIERIWIFCVAGGLMILPVACDQEPTAQSETSNAVSKSDATAPEITESTLPAADDGGDVDSR